MNLSETDFTGKALDHDRTIKQLLALARDTGRQELNHREACEQADRSPKDQALKTRTWMLAEWFFPRHRRH